MQVKLITGLVAGMFAVGFAIAQSAPSAPAAADPAHGHHSANGHHQAGKHFTQLDKNGDGAVSREEAAAHPMLSKGFDMVDTNRDGKLVKDEMQAAGKAMHGMRKQAAEARFKAADTDADGALSKAEAETGMLTKVARHFDRVDANKDSRVSLEEFQAMRTSRHGHGRHHAKAEHMFKLADQDRDGSVTRQEAETAARLHVAQKFERQDANKDGKLTLEEMRAGRHAHHKPRNAT